MILYHFTSPLHLPVIQDTGYIDTTESNLHPTIERYGPDCAWFLDQPELGSADHGLTASSLSSWLDKTKVRITVDVPDTWAVYWLGWAEAQGISQHWLKALLGGTTGGREAAERWVVTFRTVPRSRWVAVDMV